MYYGVFAPPPEAVVSPNGDGVAETQKLSYKIVRPSTVTATLTAPDGVRRRSPRRRARAPGTYPVAFPPVPLDPAADRLLPPAEGRWRLDVAATDDQGADLDDDSQRFIGQLDARRSLRLARRNARRAPTRRQADHARRCDADACRRACR